MCDVKCMCASVQGVNVCVNEMTIVFTYALICVYDMPERKNFDLSSTDN